MVLFCALHRRSPVSAVAKPQKICYTERTEMEGNAMKQYSREFKEEALKLSDEIGVKNAAKRLGVAYYTLAD